MFKIKNVLPAITVSLISLLFLFCFYPANARAAAANSAGSARGPEVTHTATAPTGYTVTFRYANPGAKSVLIKGEWYFERPSEQPLLSPTPDHPIVESQGILPADWKSGDVPLQRPNSTGPNFPISPMTKDKNGVWTFTTPCFSPNGVTTHNGPAPEVSTLAKAGVPVTTDFIHGGHEWYTWRILLKDFLTRTAFLPQPYATWQQ